jgi:flagellar basal-body rod modification protein FlgD
MTMPVNGIGAGGGFGQGGPSSAGAIASLSANEFLNLLVTELQNQNPLSPMDPSQMVSQTSSLSMVELLSTIQSEVAQLQSSEGILQASSLIGQSVTYQVGSQELSGTVQGVGQSASGVVLDIAGQSVPMTNVLAVGMVPSGANAAQPAGSTNQSSA